MKKHMIFAAISFAAFLFSTGAWAEGRPWKDHQSPFDFIFGNQIDTHQQTRLEKNGELFGFLYITFTDDPDYNGLPVAEHCDMDTPPEDCEVGWIVRGVPAEAMLVHHDMDHPVWLVDRADIPQPGSYTHFHWTGGSIEGMEGHVFEGFFLQLEAIRSFAFHHADNFLPVSPGIDNATHVNIVGSFP